MQCVGRYRVIQRPDGAEPDLDHFLTIGRRSVIEAHAFKVDELPLDTFDPQTRFAIFWLRAFGTAAVNKGESVFHAQSSQLRIDELRPRILQETKSGFSITLEHPENLNDRSSIIEVVGGWAPPGRPTALKARLRYSSPPAGPGRHAPVGHRRGVGEPASRFRPRWQWRSLRASGTAGQSRLGRRHGAPATVHQASSSFDELEPRDDRHPLGRCAAAARRGRCSATAMLMDSKCPSTRPSTRQPTSRTGRPPTGVTSPSRPPSWSSSWRRSPATSAAAVAPASCSGGDRLFHLDQGMGGGKSHALVGLWHLASHP